MTLQRAHLSAHIRSSQRPPSKEQRVTVRQQLGRITDKTGYILARAPNHPHANAGGYVREHRLVMERELGRFLSPDEVVQHQDGDKANNAPENLVLFASNSEHKQSAMLGNSWAKGDVGNPKRSYRVRRTPDEILADLDALIERLQRPIRRSDLVPPQPSHKAVKRAFGSWQQGVELVLQRRAMTSRTVSHDEGDAA